MQRLMRRVAVIGGVRIPFCRSNTFYADLSNLDMMTGALNALVDRYNLKGQHIDEVVGGAVVRGNRKVGRERVEIPLALPCRVRTRHAASLAGSRTALSLPGAYASGPGRGTRTTPNPSGSASVTARVLQYGFAGSTGSAPTRLRVASTASASPR